VRVGSQSKLLAGLAAGLLALAGYAIWNATRTESGSTTIERAPEIPSAPPREPSTREPERTRVEAPGARPAPGTSTEEFFSPGRVRGQIDAAPGASMPAQYELLVDSPGSPTRHYVFPGAERLVTIDLPPGRSVLSARGDALASRQLVIERAGDAALPPFRLVLEPAGRVNGQVLDARGAPLAGLPVALVATSNREVRNVSSDGEGRYSFADVPAGAYRVAFGAADSPIAPVVAAQVAPNDVLEVPPQAMPDLGEGEIRVADRANRPVAGARVFGAGQSGGFIDGVSDEQGVVRARFLPAGTFFLNVAADGNRSGQGQLEVSAGRIGRAVIQVRD